MEDLIQQLCRANPTLSEAQVRAYVLSQLRGQSDREYSSSFRSLLDESGEPADGAVAADANLGMRCHCGKCAFKIRVSGSEGQPPSLIRCHCPACRRFHSTSYGTFVPVPTSSELEDWTLGGKAMIYKETCAALGPVERVICTKCYSTLATISSEENAKGIRAVLAAGCIEDSTVPRPLAKLWQTEFQEWEVASAAKWWTAVPRRCDGRRTADALGGCACGAVRFRAAIFPGEAQHCYCNACRRLGGAASMTWIPSSNEGFRWTKKDSLRLVRTTRHGQRHMCTRCGTTLTIVYDSQPDCTWPVAGVLDDDSLPEDLDNSWYRVIHICCSMMQPWYRLPDDDLPRLKYAG